MYVWRQRDAEAVAGNIVAAGVEGGIVFYHGGMNADARSRSQSKVRILNVPRIERVSNNLMISLHCSS